MKNFLALLALVLVGYVFADEIAPSVYAQFFGIEVKQRVASHGGSVGISATNRVERPLHVSKLVCTLRSPDAKGEEVVLAVGERLEPGKSVHVKTESAKAIQGMRCTAEYTVL